MDADTPLEERELYEVRKVKQGRKSFTTVYYRGVCALALCNTPEPDGSQELTIRYYTPEKINIQALNIILRSLGIGIKIVGKYGYRRIESAGGSHPDNFIYTTPNWFQYYEGSPYKLYVYIDKHNPRNKSCMCEECLRKDAGCQENLSSSMTASAKKKKRSSRNSRA